MAQDTDVLIVGAGPTGLVLALWLIKQGVKVRIIDKSSGPGETSRAMVVQARTLELYRQLDLADAVINAGYKAPAMNIWARGTRRAQVKLAEAAVDLTPYPFVLVFPQDKHERLLIDRLATLGVQVERETALQSFEDDGTHVHAVLTRQDGSQETCVAQYIAGCDGARSIVRHQINGGFDGGTYKQLFYVADVTATGVNPPDQLHIAFDKSDFVLVIYYGDANRYRLIGTVRDDRVDHPETLTFDDVGHAAIDGLGLTIGSVAWFSTYRVHHRVTDHFRRGRAFLLGDAAHVHSPAGGQGMNTGILDAINLAWKLAAVLKGQAQPGLLDSYEIERQAFARKLVETTDRAFTFVTAEGNIADFIRTRIAPLVASAATKLESVRELMFRIVSQTMLNYRDSPLSKGEAGSVFGGDRLPFVRLAKGDNFAASATIAWQVHVYGDAKADLRVWCEQNAVSLHVFAWTPACEAAGLARDAAYLIRPDGYVGLADPSGALTAIEDYLAAHGLRLSVHATA